MQIINTSNGPAILTDEGDVVMASDFVGIKNILRVAPSVVTELVAALDQRIDAAEPLIARVEKLEVLSDHELAVLQKATGVISNIQVIGYAILAVAQEQGEHEHE
jgi:uncharacterized protein with PIN domain